MTKPEPAQLAIAFSARRVIAAMGGLALAVILLVWGAHITNLRGNDLVEVLERHWVPLGLAALASVGTQSWFSACKWHLLYERSHRGTGKHAEKKKLTLYSALAILFSQIMPASIAVLIVRSLATRFEMGGSWTQGAAITVYDQLFDVGVLMIVAIGCAGVFWLGFPQEISLASVLISLAIALVTAAPLFALVKPLKLARAIFPERFPGFRRVTNSLAFAHDRGLDSPEVAARLLRLSILRYLAIGARSVAALLLIVPALSWVDAAWGFGLVQTSALLALTPGNVGITEWGWGGIEILLEKDAGVLALAILALRILTLPATILVVAASWLTVRFSRGG